LQHLDGLIIWMLFVNVKGCINILKTMRDFGRQQKNQPISNFPESHYKMSLILQANNIFFNSLSIVTSRYISRKRDISSTIIRKNRFLYK
jgi:hypothetical protein